MIDNAWAGNVDFYEVLFGVWLAYGFLVLLWEYVFRAPLPEWKYMVLTLFGAGAFLINHYFQYAPFWLTALNTYTLLFFIAWYFLAVRPQQRSVLWQIGATLSAAVFSAAFIGFEMLSRFGFNRGIHEFWFVLIAYCGFLFLILWRAQR